MFHIPLALGLIRVIVTNLSQWLPTRLVEISNDAGALGTKLRLSASLPGTIEYMAIRHCWGTKEGTKLIRESTGAFIERLPLRALPKTF